MRLPLSFEYHRGESSKCRRVGAPLGELDAGASAGLAAHKVEGGVRAYCTGTSAGEGGAEAKRLRTRTEAVQCQSGVGLCCCHRRF
ncbi:hypothetical protein AK812_SmicGene16388 [Symbiodinium microadriaticum]|uniref:Uncharacterized protein n=1 Tax=Symbiodinium microadriaticum TaxID=2951 RepID=A0A1Q9E0F6_SYMMI|nr:hypothetical protein AK812_SmicGene16388 [Symbiodinium microadriaticum]